MREAIYLETTLFNYYYLTDTERGSDRDATVELFKQVKTGKFKGYISQITLDELAACDDESKREKMLKLITLYGIIKLPQDDVKNYEILASEYISAGAIPEKKRGDALHIAAATLNNLDILVSWNCDHIVRYKTQQVVRKINLSKNYKDISINTPEEVIIYD